MFRLFVRCVKTGRPFSFIARECYALGHRFAYRPDDGGQIIVSVENCETVEVAPPWLSVRMFSQRFTLTPRRLGQASPA